ncbi:type IV leader peptidase family [Gottschalkia purinilytica]|uniref:Type IV leader peptidase family n=1 Tax=Gottschalkia purinilytica TaxID=1503 RepID=A0A0L0WEE9_GOTPU|nr:type IV leader peptidase family [Gottschalkia purinilytica]
MKFAFLLLLLIITYLCMYISFVSIDTLKRKFHKVCPNCNEELKKSKKILTLCLCKNCNLYSSMQIKFIIIAMLLVCILTYVKFGTSIYTLKYSLLFIILIIITTIDYKYMIIPDNLLIVGAVFCFFINLLFYRQIIKNQVSIEFTALVFVSSKKRQKQFKKHYLLFEWFFLTYHRLRESIFSLSFLQSVQATEQLF